MTKDRVIAALAILLAVGGWLVTLDSWSVALEIKNVGGLLMIVCPVAATALGGSIKLPKS